MIIARKWDLIFIPGLFTFFHKNYGKYFSGGIEKIRQQPFGSAIENGRDVYLYDIKLNIKLFRIFQPAFQFLKLLA